MATYKRTAPKGWRDKPLARAAELAVRLIQGAATDDAAAVGDALAAGVRPDVTRSGESALTIAARAGSIEVMIRLLDAGAPLGVSLREAAEHGRLEAVRLLLDRGADVDAADRWGDTALGRATMSGHDRVAALLRERGATVDAKSDEPEELTPAEALFRAARAGEVATVERLLDAGGDVRARGPYEESLLAVAAGEARLEMVALLLARLGEEPPQDHLDEALVEACGCFEGDPLAVVERLLAAGADPGAANHYQSALCAAASRGFTPVAMLLLDRGAPAGPGLVRCAAEGGSIELVERALELGGAVEDPDDQGRTALIAAAECGARDVVALLLERGAEVTAKDSGGKNALDAAAERGHRAVAELLLGAGCEAKRAVQAAAAGESRALVELLLERGADVNGNSDDGWTALMRAADHGDCQLLGVLLDHGAHLDRQDIIGRTALMKAASGGHYACVQMLLAAGAGVHIEAYNDTALSQAIERGQVAIAELLLAEGARLGSTVAAHAAYVRAAENGAVDLLEMLADAGADPLVEREYHDSPLERAAAAGHLGAVRFFLERGATQHRRDKAPLERAARNGHAAVVTLLLEHGGAADAGELLLAGAEGGSVELVELALRDIDDVDAPRHWGDKTALHLAAANGHVEVVRLLLDRGADLEAKDDRGNTASSLAHGAPHPEVIELLVSRGARREVIDLVPAAAAGEMSRVRELMDEPINLDVRGELGRTALMEATAGGHSTVAGVLLEAGVDVNLADEDGWTALMEAADAGDAALAALLLEAGADARPADHAGFDAARIARESGHPELAALLAERAAAAVAAEQQEAAAAGDEDDSTEDDATEDDPPEDGDDEAEYPLHEAASEGDAARVIELLAAGHEVGALDWGERTAAERAAENGHPGILGVLAEAGASLRGCLRATAYWHHELTASLVERCLAHGDALDDRDERGATALIHAASRGDEGSVAVLVTGGASLDLEDEKGTALFHAAEQGHAGVIDALLEAGASVAGTDWRGWTVPMYVAKLGDPKRLARVIERGGARAGCLIGGAASGKVAMVRACLKLDEDVRAVDGEGFTAAMRAAEAGRTKALDHLCERGSPTDGLVFGAVGSAKKAMVEACLERGGDLEWRSPSRQTPLMRAAEDELPEIVALLLERGAEVDAADEDGWTALMYAAESRSRAVVRALVEAGADRTVTDDDGMTAYDRVASDDMEDLFARLDGEVSMRELLRP